MTLTLTNLTKQYGNFTALENFTYDFTAGVYGLLGPNGAGKSTLMNIITDNLNADSGEVLYDGEEIKKLGKDYRTILGYMPQQQGLYDDFTLNRFLWYMAALKGLKKKEAKQKIADYAAHNATMVIFLSSSMLEKLQKELIAGGYKEDTPAAIVYKASWPDEKVCRCTVGTIAETAAKYNITKTALITVGYFLGSEYDRSELYNPTFAHGYREADPSKLDIKPEVK